MMVVTVMLVVQQQLLLQQQLVAMAAAKDMLKTVQVMEIVVQNLGLLMASLIVKIKHGVVT